MPDFIVVGSDGTEHHFPDGMDPQRAIQVVKNTELATANARPLNEPTTYDEGRKQSIAKTVSDTGRSILKGVTSMFSREPDKTSEQLAAEVKANPPSFDPMGAGRRIIKGLKSTASNLTTPEGGGEAIGNLVTLGAMGRATDAIGKIPTDKASLGRAMQTVGDFKINKPLEMIKKAGQQLEESQANVPPAGVDRYKPSVSGMPDRGVEQGEMPLSTAAMTDAHMPNRSGYRPEQLDEGAGHIEGAGINHNLPNRSGYVPEELGSGAGHIEGSGVDPHLANRSGYEGDSGSRNTSLRAGGDGPVEVETAQDVLRRLSSASGSGIQTDRIPLTGDAPARPAEGQTLDQILREALEQSLAESKDRPQLTTLPEDRSVAGMQKGKVGKRPGGYTTDLPPITGARQNELLDRGSTEVGGQPAPLESAGSASPAGGDVAPVPNTKPKLSADEVAAVGRRMYGSRDAGAMLYGNSLSPAERAEAIKRMAPGPSRLPLTAEARINGQPRDLSLEEALKNLIIESKGKPQ